MKVNFKNLLNNFEKVIKKYSRYLFRYLPSKFLGAVECSQVQKSAFKRYKMLSKALKNPKSFLHVVADASINFVVVNNAKNLCEIWLYKGFYNSTF